MRLNKVLRDRIEENAVKSSGVTARKEALLRDQAQLAEDCWSDWSCGKTVEEVRAAFQEVQDKLVQVLPGEAKIHKIQGDEGRLISVAFGGCWLNLEFPEARPQPSSTLRYPADHIFTTRFREIEKEERSIADQARQVRQAVRASFLGVTTVKKLLEAWPEVEELLPKDENGKQTTALAIDVKQLNAMCGLPTEKK